mgnify:CR=1 FL=1|tara:strand:- start:8048 stop:8524 length:477 start_codon:yes stop_codon:yes gene_type:complete
MADLSDFHTREVANEGIKVPLSLPNGDKSEEYLLIRGIDSDEFRRANIKKQRDLVNLAQLSADEREAVLDRASVELIASLVIGWSFKAQFNEKNLTEWLSSSPQIADMIDRIASQRGLFIKKKPNSSLPLLDTKSAKTKQSKARTSSRKPTISKSKKP